MKYYNLVVLAVGLVLSSSVEGRLRQDVTQEEDAGHDKGFHIKGKANDEDRNLQVQLPETGAPTETPEAVQLPETEAPTETPETDAPTEAMTEEPTETPETDAPTATITEEPTETPETDAPTATFSEEPTETPETG